MRLIWHMTLHLQYERRWGVMKSLVASVGVGLSALIAAATPAGAATPTPLFQYGTIYGSYGTITIQRLPVVLPNGGYAYKDVTIRLQSNNSGVLAFTASPLTQAPSPTPTTGNLRSGEYYTDADPTRGFQMKGPSASGQGYDVWTLSVDNTFNVSPYEVPAVIYTGNLANTDIEARLKKAGITGTEYSYGETLAGSSDGSGRIIGLQVLGSQMRVSIFTDGGGADHSTPVSSYLVDLK